MIALLLKASLVITVFLFFYKAFLEKESFFSTNRIFLLSALALTFTLPFITLPQLVNDQGIISSLIEKHIVKETPTTATKPSSIQAQKLHKAEQQMKNDIPVPSSTTNINQTVIEESSATIASTPTQVFAKNQTKPKKGISHWLLMIYYFGVVIFSLNFIFQIGNVLLNIIQSSDKIEDTNDIIINSPAMTEPCSFFHYIFINPESYDYDTYEQILAHEKIHVKKKHTFDLLLSELAVVFLWFNPLAWLFRKEVEKNIEYQTDDILLNGETIERESYQMNLLKVAAHSMPLTITTNYNQSLIKQRIMKISAKKSNPQSLWKYAFVFPIVFTLLLVINKPNIAIANPTNESLTSLEDKKSTAKSSDKNEKFNIAAFLKNYKNLSESEKLELLSLLKESTAASVEHQSTLSSQTLVESNNTLQANQQTSSPTPDSIKKPPSTNVKIFADLDPNEKKEVLGILEKFDELENTASFEDLSEDTKKEVAKLLTNTSAPEDFEFEINYEGVKGLENVTINFKFEDITIDEKIKVIETIDNLDNQTEAQKRECHQIFSIHDDLEMEDVLLVLEGKKKMKDFADRTLSNEKTYDENSTDCEALLAAIRKEKPSDVIELLKNIDPNCTVRDPGNETFIEGNTTWNILRAQTPLVAAGRVGNFEIAKLLIEKGADVNLHGHANETPLMAATKYGNLDFVKYLVMNGANIKALVKHWGSSQSIASRYGHLAIVKYLNSEKAEIDARVAHVGTSLIEASKNGHLDIVKFLIEKGANVNADEAHVGTPLIVASKNGHLEIAKYLVSKGADIYKGVAHVGTPLIVASKNGYFELVKFLLNKGANPNDAIAHVGTPLIAASRDNKLAIVKHLITKGADVNKSVAHVGTPLLLAAQDGKMEVVKYLIANGADVNKEVAHVGTPLINAAQDGEMAAVKYLIAKGADVNKEVAHIGTPLLNAAQDGEMAAVKYLVANGADVNKEVAHVGTPLLSAAQDGEMTAVKYLISKGADVNKEVPHVGTPLSVAIHNGQNRIAKYLRSKGARD